MIWPAKSLFLVLIAVELYKDLFYNTFSKEFPIFLSLTL